MQEMVQFSDTESVHTPAVTATDLRIPRTQSDVVPVCPSAAEVWV